MSKRHERRLRGVLSASILVLLSVLAGCAHNITTPQQNVVARPDGAPTFSLPPQSVSDLGSKPAFEFGHFDAELRNSLLRESAGQIAWDVEDADLVLAEANLLAEPAQQHFLPAFTMGMLTLAVPPLGAIPQTKTASYVLEYAIDDPAGRQVLAGRISGQIAGRYLGMYVGRIDAEQKLMKAQAAFMADHAGRSLINELRAKHEVLAQAVSRHRSAPKATEKQLAANAKRREVRANRRRARYDESDALFRMKKHQGPPPPVFGVAGAIVPRYESGAPQGNLMAQRRAARAAAAPVVAPAPVRGRAVVLTPTTSVGDADVFQERILANSLRSTLSSSHELLGVDRTATLQAATGSASGDVTCASEACLATLRERAGVDRAYALEILRDTSGTQLVLRMSDRGEVRSKSTFCPGCDTAGLDTALGEMLVALTPSPAAPPAAVPAGFPMPASGPAAPETSVGQQLMDGAVDMAKQCAAKLVAEQACSAVPSFGATACKIAVGVKFKGAICP